MSCPGFGERDAALRQMMGPPTAQQHLRDSMRRDLDPRWHLLPVEDKPPRSYGWLIWPALVLGLAACAAIASI
jgi:hypothetical protein